MEKVKVNTDGSIDFKTGESIPTTAKRFRQSPEIEAFYRFIYENDLREEAHFVLSGIQEEREELKAVEKEKKKEAKKQARAASKSTTKQKKTTAKKKAKSK